MGKLNVMHITGTACGGAICFAAFSDICNMHPLWPLALVGACFGGCLAWHNDKKDAQLKNA
jgi:hypothetical protein